MQVQTKTNLTYKVKKNDNLESICNKFKVDITETKLLNQINDIEEDDIILLPRSYSFSYVVKPLDTIEKIANKCNVDTNTVKMALKGKNLFIGQKILF